MAKPTVQSKLKLKYPLWLYILGLIFFVYLFSQILGFRADDSHNIFLTGLYFVEFGVHEASHIVTAFLPSIATAAAGSIGEVLFTVLILVATIKGRAYFAAVFAGLWVMLAMHNAGIYMADARSQLLPLIGPGETVQHDWHFVFGQLGWLDKDILIGGAVMNIGMGVGILALLWGLFLIILKIMKKV
ncbi:MAG: hypothetical protein JWN12_411 [Candidatus Saccharibacteria bacterium]|nr:hypothetical protein [Candidatus Saccharibacteria bacterium]